MCDFAPLPLRGSRLETSGEEWIEEEMEPQIKPQSNKKFKLLTKKIKKKNDH